MPVQLYLSLLLAVAGYTSSCTHADTQPVQVPTVQPDTSITFSIGAVGDLMCHSTQFNNARVQGDTFDFSGSFEFVAPIISSVDLMLGNLETTLAGDRTAYSGYPQFNTPDAYATALKSSGFDCIITANNHSNDTGEEGILRTISVLDKLGLHHTGSFTSAQDRDSVRIYTVQGVKVGIAAYTYSTNGLPLTDGKPWLVNMIDSALIKKDIAAGRAHGAELMIVFFHFGDEYQRLPNSYQKSYTQLAIDCGADIIFGSHPHVLQPAGFYPGNGSTVDSVYVAWSMGNFISNQQDEYTDEGVIVQLQITKDLRSGKINITEAKHVPTWVYRGKLADRKVHTVFPIVDTAYTGIPTYILENYRSELDKAWTHTQKTLSTPVPLNKK